ncbi:MAG: hypothetical protein AB1668_04615 [Nanoarchaeota archaeon]
MNFKKLIKLINKDHKAKLAIGILILMVIVVMTSFVILLLVQSGIFVVKADVSTEPMLNAEFLPMGRGGNIALKEFAFCNFVDDKFNCLNVQSEFNKEENIYLRFVVESTVNNGEIMVVHNYRVKSPSGKTILEAEQKDDFTFEMKSSKKAEPIVFSEYFNLGGAAELELGEYSLELIVKNPLLDKEVTLTKEFKVV